MRIRQLTAGFAAGLLAVTGVAIVDAGHSPAYSAPASQGVLHDIIVDQAPVLSAPFSTDVHSYRGTIYRSRDEVTIKAVTSGELPVTINGETPDAFTKRVTVPVKLGANTVEVKAGDQTYTLNLTKVDTDYLGRKPIVSDDIKVIEWSDATVTAANRTPENFLSPHDPDKGNGMQNFFRTKTPPPEANALDDPNAVWWVVDLGRDYDISKIEFRGLKDFKAYPDRDPTGTWLGLSYKASDAKDYTEGPHQIALGGYNRGINRAELGKSVKARYLRFTWVHLDKKTGNPFLWDAKFFEDTNPELINGDLTAAPKNPTSVAPSDKGVNRGQSAAVDRGIQWGGWAPSGGYARPIFTNKELADWGGNLAMVYNELTLPNLPINVETTDKYLTNDEWLQTHPNAAWGLAFAPHSMRGMDGAGEPRQFLTQTQLDYLGNARFFGFGDEGKYNPAELDMFTKWFAFSKENYPGVLVHSNQASGWWTVNDLQEYSTKAKPDLLTFDYYYSRNKWRWKSPNETWNKIGRTSEPHAQTYHLLSGADKFQQWQRHREAALEGPDGTGKNPMVFGQYLDSFDYNAAESQKAYLVNLSLASGMKWLSFFRFEHAFDGTFLWDADGQPTKAFWEYAQIKKDTDVIGGYLTRLHNTYLVDQPGQYQDRSQAQEKNPVPTVTDPENTSGVMYKFGEFAASAEQNKEYGLLGVRAQNLGTTNNGLPGDVLIGYFDALPGLEDKYVTEKFGVADPKAMYVTNGLIDTAKLTETQQADWASNRVDDGAYAQTAQKITLTLADTGRVLRKVDPATGDSAPVELKAGADGTSSVELTLGGGKGVLLYWAEKADTEPTPTGEPTEAPTVEPTEGPTTTPTGEPTSAPSAPTGEPTAAPSAPTAAPSAPGGRGPLARTGVDAPIALTLALLGAGGMLVLAGRRVTALRR